MTDTQAAIVEIEKAIGVLRTSRSSSVMCASLVNILQRAIDTLAPDNASSNSQVASTSPSPRASTPSPENDP